MHTWFMYCPRPKTSNDGSRRKGGRVFCLAWFKPVLTFRSVVWRLDPGTVMNPIELSCREASGGNLSLHCCSFIFLRQWFVLSKYVSECFSIYYASRFTLFLQCWNGQLFGFSFLYPWRQQGRRVILYTIQRENLKHFWRNWRGWGTNLSKLTINYLMDSE